MRTEEGDEIIEPGEYDLDGATLRVWLTEDEDAPEGERVKMWACTHCQEVDGTLNALLVGVIDGMYSTTQREDGEFMFSFTEHGLEQAKALMKRLGSEEPDAAREEPTDG